jgi:hypothetical protein
MSRPRVTLFVPRVESLEDRLVLAGGSNVAYVAQLYQDLLQRNADPQGLTYWAGQLDAGQPRSQVVAAFESSPEYLNNWINRQFQSFLIRPADPTGLAAFRQQLDNGASTRNVLMQILTSDEYYLNRSGGSEVMYLTALYHDLMGRDASLNERSLYAKPGTPRADVVRAILTSQEWSEREVQILYQEYLFRPADADGLQMFAASLRQGASIENVLAALLGSPEHFAQASQLPQAANVAIRHYQVVVEKLYTQFLGRGAQLSELGRWVDAFAGAARQGQHLDEVLVAFFNSPEALRTLVARWYQHDLDRTATLDQLKALPEVVDAANALANGADFFDTRAGILASPEFYSLSGNTDAGLATRLYEKVLDREPTDAEQNTLVTQLSQGTRQAVIESFLEQPEATQTVAAHWFQDYLGARSSVQALKSYTPVTQWGTRLGDYRDYTALLAMLLASADYLGFPEDLFSLPVGELARAQGPFALPPNLQRGTSPTYATGDPILTTSYFYWYTVNGPASRFLKNNDGSDRLTDHPPSLDGFDYMNVDWHKQQLQDMSDAGIDVALPVYHGSPFSDWQFNPDNYTLELRQFDQFSDPGLVQMVKARRELLNAGKSPPLLGMFFDTSVLTRDDKDWYVDCATFAGKVWFYETIRNFFSHIPSSDWARIDGRPLVFLYHPSNAHGVDESLVDFLQTSFVRDFGVRMYIVSGNEVTAPLILNPQGMKLWADQMRPDNYYTVLSEFLAGDAFYQVAGGTPDGYVRRLFDKLMNRQPSPDELSTWVFAVNSTSRLNVAQILVQTPEAARTTVARWYQYYLKRTDSLDAIESGHEIDPWVNGLLSGVPPSAVLAQILASDEFYWISGQSNTALIDNVYQQAFMRNASDNAADRSMWIGRLNVGPRAAVLADLLESDLAHQVTASIWHWFYLGQFNIGPVDAFFEWGGALHAQFRAVAGFGPGYNQDNNKHRPPLSVDRENGDLYRRNWTTFLAMHKRSWIVHLESWNEYFEGSDIAASSEYGRQYIDLTRQYADIYHQNLP